jgi:stage III sporulation protein SpoIIIAA
MMRYIGYVIERSSQEHEVSDCVIDVGEHLDIDTIKEYIVSCHSGITEEDVVLLSVLEL